MLLRRCKLVFVLKVYVNVQTGEVVPHMQQQLAVAKLNEERLISEVCFKIARQVRVFNVFYCRLQLYTQGKAPQQFRALHLDLVHNRFSTQPTAANVWYRNKLISHVGCANGDLIRLAWLLQLHSRLESLTAKELLGCRSFHPLLLLASSCHVFPLGE